MSGTLLIDKSVSLTTTSQYQQGTLSTSAYFQNLQSGTSHTQQRNNAVESSTLGVAPTSTDIASSGDAGVSIVSLGGATTAISNSSTPNRPDYNASTNSIQNTATISQKSGWLITLTVLTSLLVSTL